MKALERLEAGLAVARGYGRTPRLSLDAAASFATYVDSARVRAGVEGRTLVYTVRWGEQGDPPVVLGARPGAPRSAPPSAPARRKPKR